MVIESPYPQDPGDERREDGRLFHSIDRFLKGDESTPEVVFPRPRIEGLGQETTRRLDELMRSIPTDELDETNSKKDVLTSFYLNDGFVRQFIKPIVSELMDRTTQMVYIAEGQRIGYAYAEGSDDAEVEDGIYLVLEEDDLNNEFAPIHTLDKMQEIWDSSEHAVRADIISFAAYSKRNLINLFYAYADRYARPV